MDAETQRKLDEKFLRDKFIRSFNVRPVRLPEMIHSPLASLPGHIAAALIAKWPYATEIFDLDDNHLAKLAEITRVICDAIAEEMEKSKLFAPAVIHPPADSEKSP